MSIEQLLEAMTDKQKVFCEAYIRTLNGTTASEEALYHNPRQAAYENLTKPYIREYIDRRLQVLHKPDPEVFARLGEIAIVSIADFLDEHGCINLEMVMKHGHLVKRYKNRVQRRLSTNEITVTDQEIELHDPVPVLLTLARKKLSNEDNDGAKQVYNVVVQVLDEMLPREMVGKILRRMADAFAAMNRR